MCTPVAFSSFPSGLARVPQESLDMKVEDWRENFNTITTALSLCVGRGTRLLGKVMQM